MLEYDGRTASDTNGWNSAVLTNDVASDSSIKSRTDAGTRLVAKFAQLANEATDSSKKGTRKSSGREPEVMEGMTLECISGNISKSIVWEGYARTAPLFSAWKTQPSYCTWREIEI